MVVFKGDETDEEIIAALNREINSRTSYGVRLEPGPRRGVVSFMWSNGGACWYASPAYGSPLGYRLDANEIVARGIGSKRLKGLVDNLDDLPLYSGSTEARGRGIFGLKGKEIPPGIKGAMLESEAAGQLLDVQTQLALEEKFREN